MSKFPGGIFSKARGKTSGIVFSAARTRQGKLMTSRALVIPANPQTVPQQDNRGIFKFVQEAVRAYGTGVYRVQFNRAVEDLPGYQSLLSVIRRAYNRVSPTLYRAQFLPSAQLQGDLHFPDTVTVAYDGLVPQVDWSTELGDNGSNDDQVTVLFANYEVDIGDEQQWGWDFKTANRSAGTVTASPVGDMRDGALVGLYVSNSLNEAPFDKSDVHWYIEIAP